VLLVGGSSNWHPNGSWSRWSLCFQVKVDLQLRGTSIGESGGSGGPWSAPCRRTGLIPRVSRCSGVWSPRLSSASGGRCGLRELRAHGQDGSEEADALAALHSASAKTLGQLLGLLRATPRSRVVSRDAGPKVDEAPQARPWEIQARG
jgi:hypothetical protein